MAIPHYEIAKKLEEKYKKNKNVVGIYLFGSLARGDAIKESDLDIEIVFKKRRKKYELINKIIQGVKIDLSLFREDQFIKEFSETPYLAYGALDYKILYDPKGIIKKHLKKVKIYFSKNPDILKFWQKKERAWKRYKKRGKKGKGENYFGIMEELKHKLK